MLRLQQADATYLIVNDQAKIEDFGLNAVCTHLGCVVPWNVVGSTGMPGVTCCWHAHLAILRMPACWQRLLLATFGHSLQRTHLNVHQFRVWNALAGERRGLNFGIYQAQCACAGKHKYLTLFLSAVQNEKKFMCPCHGSQYNFQGKVVRGPAPLVSPF